MSTPSPTRGTPSDAATTPTSVMVAPVLPIDPGVLQALVGAATTEMMIAVVQESRDMTGLAIEIEAVAKVLTTVVTAKVVPIVHRLHHALASQKTIPVRNQMIPNGGVEYVVKTLASVSVRGVCKRVIPPIKRLVPMSLARNPLDSHGTTHALASDVELHRLNTNHGSVPNVARFASSIVNTILVYLSTTTTMIVKSKSELHTFQKQCRR